MAPTLCLDPAILRRVAVVAGRTMVLGCTTQVPFTFTGVALGELLVQRSGPVMDVRRGLTCCGREFGCHYGCSPSPIAVLAGDPHLLNA
jgi:hypothetical protein